MGAEKNVIKIRDLANPVNTPELLKKQEMVKDVEVDLTVEAIVAAAHERTGFDNFNGEEFLPHYEVLMRAYREEVNLNNFGKLTLFEICVRYLSNRLKVEELYRRHPEIEDVELEAPVIITGLPRTGTTHLHNLIYADGRFRGLHYYEASYPVPDDIDTMPESKEVDSRYQRCLEEVAQMKKDMPYFSAMHDIDPPDHLHEEIGLLAMEGLTATFQVYAPIPAYRDYLRSVDKTSAYQYVKRALKAISWLKGPNRWVLKAPEHISCLPAMMRVFPDATVVFTHRDPIGVVASMATMCTYTRRVVSNLIDTRMEGEYWAENCEYHMRQLVETRSLIQDAQSVDIYFAEFVQDNITAVQRVFDTAGIKMREKERGHLQRFIDENPRSKHGKIVYDLKGDFGFDINDLRARFQFYVDHFNIPQEA